MDRFLTHPGSAGNSCGRINAVAAITLAVSVIVGIGATLAFSQHGPITLVTLPLDAGDPLNAVPTHTLPISATAETYSDSNPQPVAF